MKVIQANKFFYVRGGAERYFLDLTHLLPSRNMPVAPFSMQDPHNLPSPFSDYFVPRVDYRAPRSAFQSLGDAARTMYHRRARTLAESLSETFDPDVAHLHNIHHQLTGSIIDAFSRRSIPMVQTLHDYQWICPAYTFLSHGEVCEACKGRRFHRAVSKRCQDGSWARSAVAALELWIGYQRGWIDRIHAFLAPSRFLADKMVEHGIPRARVRQLNYCLNLEQYRESGSRGAHALYAGRLSQEKGVHTLLKALEHLPGLSLRVAGSGPLEAELQGFAEERAPNRVTFLGHLNPRELHREVSSAAFVVVPSEWYENQPFAILESFALRTPVVGASIGGIPELVIPGQTGWLFEPGDVNSLTEALQAAFTSSTRSDLGHQARGVVESDFDPGKHLDALTSIYREARA